MFNSLIYSTDFTSEAADRLFLNITASPEHAPDKSFLSTLRALLHKRLPQNETVKLTYRTLDISNENISNYTPSQYINMLVPNTIYRPAENSHNIFILTTTSIEVGMKVSELLRNYAGASKRYLCDYHKQDDLRVFFARKVKALFYMDTAQRNTVIFVDKLEIKHFHILQMMIPKYLPLLFADNPLTEAEINLLKSTGSKSSTEYKMLIESFAKNFDIRDETIRIKLAGFETVFERMRVDEIKSDICICQNEYDLYLSKMREASNKIQEHRYMLAGLECVINNHSGDSELMEYFMCNKNLTLVSVIGAKIEFIAHGYADVFDEEAFEQYVVNRDGYFYNSLSPTITKNQMEKLYRALFSDGKYKLRICAAYTADVQKGLKAFVGYYYPPESSTYYPNPHIHLHGCVGTYAGRFQEYMQKKDYVGAIEQAVVSARNLNFYDSPVIAAFAKEFSRTQITCVEKSDGTLITPLEAVKELEGVILCQDQ